jgi:D-glycero-D-manno-heptose 1,7-bisphosphate phosphatase
MGVDRAAVFLDRDGVINRAEVRDGRPYPPHDVDGLELLPGVRDALVRLDAAGFDLVVVTNQPDVARGTQTQAMVEAMHAALGRMLPMIDAFRACCHDDADACSCRKPEPGLLVGAAEERGIDLGRSYMVGDRWRDVEAGRRAGCVTVFIDHGYREPLTIAPDARVRSLTEAADWIVQDRQRRARAGS